MTYYFGGIVTGRVIEVARPNRVPVTKSIEEAALLALEAKGFVYEVKPIGRVVPDRSGEPEINFLARRAKIERTLSWREVRGYVQMALSDTSDGKREDVGVDFETQDQEGDVRKEEEVQQSE